MRRSAVAAPHGSLAGRIPEIRIVLWGFLLNAVWEAAQTPLYTDRLEGPGYLFRTRLHCTVGDVLILLGCFALVSLFWRDRHWIATRLAPRVLFVTLGISYTTASELVHTRWLGSWAYAPEMPLLFGIGLTPLLQWVVVPTALLALLGRRSGPAPGPDFVPMREPSVAVDPVCGSRVETEGANQFFDGIRTLYFCSAACRRAYLANFRRQVPPSDDGRLPE